MSFIRINNGHTLVSVEQAVHRTLRRRDGFGTGSNLLCEGGIGLVK